MENTVRIFRFFVKKKKKVNRILPVFCVAQRERLPRVSHARISLLGNIWFKEGLKSKSLN